MSGPNPYSRPGSTPQEDGRRFERYWAKLFGVEPVKGSGNQWYAKLDVGTSAVLFSLKHSRTDLLRFGRRRLKVMLKEAQEAIEAPGGTGTSNIGGVAVSEDGVAYVIFRAEDFLRLAQTGEIHYITPSRGEQKRKRAAVPSLLRKEGP